jgi:hypothetical protein
VITPPQIDRNFPHRVEMRVPGGGLGFALEGIHAFCRKGSSGTRNVGRLRRIALGADAMRWCVKTTEDADAFQARFGGERLPPLTLTRIRRGAYARPKT